MEPNARIRDLIAELHPASEMTGLIEQQIINEYIRMFPDWYDLMEPTRRCSERDFEGFGNDGGEIYGFAQGPVLKEADSFLGEAVEQFLQEKGLYFRDNQVISYLGDCILINEAGETLDQKTLIKLPAFKTDAILAVEIEEYQRVRGEFSWVLRASENGTITQANLPACFEYEALCYFAHDCNTAEGFNDGRYLQSRTLLATDPEQALDRYITEYLEEEFDLSKIDRDLTAALNVSFAWKDGDYRYQYLDIQIGKKGEGDEE